jgi:enolase-phosphatase E1
VSFNLAERGLDAILLDIEGTATPIGFVYGTLFPFARKALQAYVHEHIDAPELREPVDRLREAWVRDAAGGAAPPDWRDDTRAALVSSIVGYAEWLMDRDRKERGLKSLQGLVWARGYQEGALRGEVFPDVPPALDRWRAAGKRIALFSSGSVQAQQDLFRTSTFGDLTRAISAFFDTGIGPKTSSESYRHIAAAMHCPAERMLFISDVGAELDAARAAGCSVLLCERPGNREATRADFEVVRDFSEVW